jgi:hypothetical protein
MGTREQPNAAEQDGSSSTICDGWDGVDDRHADVGGPTRV